MLITRGDRPAVTRPAPLRYCPSTAGCTLDLTGHAEENFLVCFGIVKLDLLQNGQAKGRGELIVSRVAGDARVVPAVGLFQVHQENLTGLVVQKLFTAKPEKFLKMKT